MIGDTVILSAGDISPVILFFAIGFGLLALFGLHIFRERTPRPRASTANASVQEQRDELGSDHSEQPVVHHDRHFVRPLRLLPGEPWVQRYRDGPRADTGNDRHLASVSPLGHIVSKYSKRTIVRAGFIITFTGIALVLLLGSSTSSVLAFAPGLFLIGFGCGLMLTASVDVVQGSVPESDQGALSGLSRSVSNLGSSLGTALAGAILISAWYQAFRPYRGKSGTGRDRQAGYLDRPARRRLGAQRRSGRGPARRPAPRNCRRGRADQRRRARPRTRTGADCGCRGRSPWCCCSFPSSANAGETAEQKAPAT